MPFQQQRLIKKPTAAVSCCEQEAASVVWPAVVFSILLILITYSGPVDAYSTDTPYSAIFYPASAALLLSILLVRTNIRFSIETVSAGILLLALSVLYLVGSYSSLQSIRFSTPPAVFLLLSFFGLAVTLTLMSSVFQFVWALWVAFSLPAAIALGDHMVHVFFNIAVFSSELPRLVGWIGNPNRLASISAISLFLSVWLFFNSSRKRGVYLVMACIAVAVVILTGSRSAVLALVVGFWGVLVFSHNISVVTKIFTTALTLIILVLVYVLVIDAAFGLWERSSSNERRLSYYYAAGELLASADLKQLFFGYGYGAFLEKVGSSAHSSYVRLVVDHGVFFSGLLFLFILYGFWRAWIRQNEATPLVCGGLIFLLVDSAFSTSLISVRAETVFFLALLVLMAAPRTTYASRYADGE